MHAGLVAFTTEVQEDSLPGRVVHGSAPSRFLVCSRCLVLVEVTTEVTPCSGGIAHF